MELQPLSEDMFRFAYRHSVYLAIATSIRDESIGDDVPQINREQEGWIVRGTEIFPWRHRPLCINETVHIVGPYLEGVTLAERLSNNEISLGYINRLTRALTTLERRGIHLRAIHNQAIIFLRDGGVLFLANETVSLLCDHQGPHEYAHNYRPFNHPRSEKYGHSSEERYSFALASLVYIALCGKRPWDVEDGDMLERHIMSGVLPNLHFHDPCIRPEIVNELHAVLGQPKLSPPPMKFWENFLRTYTINGTHTNISANERRMRTRRAHMFLNHLRQSQARRRRLKMHSFRIFGVMLFLLLVGLTPYILTQLTITRPVYREFSAEQMVSAYYDGVERLDRAQVSETLAPNYNPPITKEIDAFYRASRLGMIFRFQNPYIEPESWLASGRERLGTRYAVYGIDNLSLTELERSGNTVRIGVAYRHWLPLSLSSNSTQYNVQGNSEVTQRRDEVTLRKQRGRWIITRITPRAIDAQ